MVWIVVLLSVFAIAAAIGIIVYENRKSRQEKRLNEASARLMKEEYLSEVLAGKQNRISENEKKLLIRLSWNEHGKQEFVIDPTNGITFGRDQKNNVIVDYEKVSSVHCRILLNNGYLYVQDMNSLNGTFLLRGGKHYQVRNIAGIMSGDILQIGDIKFTINPFYFDMMGI